jgi:hypothetical protein
VPQFFAPVRTAPPAGSTILYQPRLLGTAQVRYADPKLKIDVLQDVMAMTEITENAVPVDWAAAEDLALTANDLQKTPTEGENAPCAPAASQVKNYAAWAKDFTTWVQNNRKLTLFRAPLANQVSRPGEAEREFRIRLQQAMRELRDAAAEKLRSKYAPKLAALEERIRRAQAIKEREAAQANRAKFDTVISLGTTLLGAFLGRKAISATSVGRAASTVRSAGRAMERAGDVTRADETVEALQQQHQQLDTEFHAEADAAAGGADAANAPLENLDLRPTRTNVNVRLVALVWLPFSRDALGLMKSAY